MLKKALILVSAFLVVLSSEVVSANEISTLRSSGTRPSGAVLIAKVDTQLSSCFYSLTDNLLFEFDISEEPITYSMYKPFTEADEGTSLWWDRSDINFDIFATLLTNGEPNLTNRIVQNPNTGQGWGTGYRTEAELFGDQVGPNGVDLGGYDITRISLRYEHVELWLFLSGTCFDVDMTMLFFGRRNRR